MLMITKISIPPRIKPTLPQFKEEAVAVVVDLTPNCSRIPAIYNYGNKPF